MTAGPGLPWSRLWREPAYTPELLTLAAVRSFGPPADRYARWLRETYPDVPPDGLVRHALARASSAAPVAGAAAALVRPFGGLAATAWLSTRTVLEIAAAYGFDPTDPHRAADLLVLLGVHDTLPVARARLAAAVSGPAATGPQATGPETAGPETARHRPGGPARSAAPVRSEDTAHPETSDSARPGGAGPQGDAARRIAGEGGWFLLRRAARRFVPGAGALLGASRLDISTRALAWRASRWYRELAEAPQELETPSGAGG